MTATTERVTPVGPTPAPAPRRRGVPARALIMCWLLVLMTVVLVAVCLITRNLLRQEAYSDAVAALEQEALEYHEVAETGVDQATRQPFPTVHALLENHVQMQYPDDDEVIFGWVEGRGYLLQSRTGPLPLDEHVDLTDTIIASPASNGVVATPAGDMQWIKVGTTAPDGGRGAYVVGYLIDRDLAEIDATIRTLALVSLLGLVFAGGAAWIVAGQILAPVRLVRQAAAEITEQDLTRRIPVAGNDDIAALSDQFNAMLDRLEQAFATQREFLDDASHELRTPITIVRGHLELMDPAGGDPAERAEVVRLCTDELDRMSRIVDDLLLLAKAERPDFVRPEPVELAELTSDVDAKVRALGDRDWRLDGIGVGIVHVDPQRVTQAMVQLAHNAVQHTGPGDRIMVGSARTGGLVSFWVTDTGPGVTPAEVEVIFDRFTRGGGRGHRGGAGLGLAIVRAIAEAHHGTVKVLSTPGSGATFGIELPGGARP
ncbi:MAG TPA: ATP-binding protein [Actinophytocola sp.]|nr:ATP-binding protein [Actinophytocola sp.]